MSIDEQELRQRLEQAARQASAPRFTAEELTRQIRRHRTRVITAVTGAVITAAAIAVTIPVALSGTSQQATSHPAPPPPELSYTVTLNGQTQAFPANGLTVPHYVITPGENLTIIVNVTVPEHVTVTALWLGITNGILSPRPGGPTNMSPILAARTHTTLSPGAHRFSLRWVVPAELHPGASRQLSAQWAWPGRAPGTAQRIIAELEVQASSGT